MSASTFPADLPPLRLLLMGYGRVAQALLPLLASRQDWLASKLGVRPVISGIGTRSYGYYIHPQGIDAHVLATQKNQLDWFKHTTTKVDDVETFIRTGKDRGAPVLVELTTLNPRDGQPALLHIRLALIAGLDVTTANKRPIAFGQADCQALPRPQTAHLRC